MITQREEKDVFIIDFFEQENWDAFDNIIKTLKEKFDIEIIEKSDGPDSRIWDLLIDGVPLSLHNNPYGNYLKATSPESINYLRESIEKFKIVFY